LIDKILWACDNSKDSSYALHYAEYFAKSLNAEIVGLYVIPDYYEVPVLEDFPSEELDLLAEWIKETESKQSDRLSGIADRAIEKGISFSSRISQGAPHSEIIKTAEEVKADLIVIGKGRADDKAILGATALKVLRRSPVPVLIARKNEGNISIKRILVPTDLYNIESQDLRFALDFSELSDAKIFSLSIIEIGDRKFPPEVVERLRGNAYNKLTQQINEAGISDKITTVVKTSKNALLGIIDFIQEKNIDLVVMNTYGGQKFRRGEFIGSVAERVVQESPCAVITVTPSENV
jgi:nucleotide-binding universal stress UspA family protein